MMICHIVYPLVTQLMHVCKSVTTRFNTWHTLLEGSCLCRQLTRIWSSA